MWTTSKYQRIFYVTIIDTARQQRKGWVRVGGFWRGLLVDNAQVFWDEGE